MAEHEKLLTDLIKIKSLSDEEEKIRDFISNWFANRGIETHLQEKNLFIHFEGVDRTKAFIFNSHMDTVTKGDKEWTYGPWTPTIIGDRLIGLGASDMKSGLTASMILAEKVSKSGRPPVDVWFTYVVKEEVDGSGSESFANWFSEEGHAVKYKDLAGIFTEPTGLKEIEHGHRGNMFIEAVSKGGSGHASRPDKLKAHSVREMVRFADALQKEFPKWRKKFSDGVFEPPTVGEMTSIHAGVVVKKNGANLEVEVASPNKFPSICVATFDVRTTPAFHEVAFDRIKKLGRKFSIKINYVFPPAPAGFTDPDEKIIKVSRKIVPKSKLTVSKGSADLGFLSSKGIKAIIFGPGQKMQAHKLNEYCYPAQIPQAVEIYRQIVDSWAK